MSYISGLKCRECGRGFPAEALYVCDFCFGPLEAVYDYDSIASVLTRETIEKRQPNMWRYRELLPIVGEPTVGTQTGGTPLIRTDRLAEALGVREVWVKNDAVNFPTLSFKDRVVAVALTRAKELGFTTAACASTGNLANAVAANASAAGMDSYVFIPSDLEAGKVLGNLIFTQNVVGIHGTYDDVNRLCSEIAGKHGWAFVNINVRAYYSEGSKSLAYEVMEQLGWKAPPNIVVPMASGSLLTKVSKAIGEFQKLGLVEDDTKTRVFGAQATGCNPIADAVKSGKDFFKPVKPNTIAKSLAIGNPADGFYANRVITESGGWAEDVSDQEIVDGTKLLAETSGIFAETAGGVTVATAKKLIEQGRIPSDDSVVLCITGNGLKTQEAVADHVGEAHAINASIDEFDALLQQAEPKTEPLVAA